MKDFKPPIATDAGLMAQWAYFSTDKPVVLSRMAIGSGKISDPADIPKLLALVNEEMDIPITEIVLDNNNPCVTVCGVIDYISVTTSFDVCELGLFIIDPVTGNEVLYCYTYTDRPELAPAGIHATEIFNITTLISRAETITIPQYNRIPYLLRSEASLLQTIVSDDVPESLYGYWLRPFDGINKEEYWDDFEAPAGAAEEILPDGSVSVKLNAYLGSNPPTDNNNLWFQFSN